MKTPTWVLVIGIFLILFGGCGVSKSTQAIFLPEMLSMQKEMVKEKTGSEPEQLLDSLFNTPEFDSLATTGEFPFSFMEESIKEVFSLSDYTIKWTVRFGYLGLPIAILLLLSGIFLFLKKSYSIKLIYGALGASIIFVIIQTIVLLSDPEAGFIAQSSAISNVFGIIMDIILLIAVLTMDKSEYLSYAELE